MIAKKYRLGEREMRKVLSKGKPFFSYMLVANTLANKENNKRYGILLSAKVASGSVNRNFWRRLFYDTVGTHTDTSPFLDIVLIPRK
jgi:ribonuclease P protein component